MAASALSNPTPSSPEHKPSAGVGVGGNCIAQIVHDNCPDLLASAGVIIEHLDAQAGNWQFSIDNGLTWRSARTDLINRPGCMGLALDRDARLRVLPFSGLEEVVARANERGAASKLSTAHAGSGRLAPAASAAAMVRIFHR